jgi:hypothetical protein
MPVCADCECYYMPDGILCNHCEEWHHLGYCLLNGRKLLADGYYESLSRTLEKGMHREGTKESTTETKRRIRGVEILESNFLSIPGRFDSCPNEPTGR